MEEAKHFETGGGSKVIPRALSRQEADRNLMIVDPGVPVVYSLTLVCTDSGISGDAVLEFECTQPGTAALAFRQTLHRVAVGGKPVTIKDGKGLSRKNGIEVESGSCWFDGEVILLRVEKGKNRVAVGFECEYAISWGEGAFKFVADDQTFVYVLNEHYGSSKLFPNFDQPSIRGVFKLNLMYPKSWGRSFSNGNPKLMFKEDLPAGCKCCSKNQPKYISSSVSLASQDPNAAGAQIEMQTNVFEQSEPLPSYLFFFYIGNFHEEICPPDALTPNIPQRFFCLPHAKSKLQEVLPILNKLTSHGLKFFQDFLKCPYPFKRYDHVYIPSGIFNVAADELPGMVIMDEYYLDKDSPYLFNDGLFILLHEMAHMWFGDLVAIEWWNEVWLKESFADLLASLAFRHIVGEPERDSALGFLSNKNVDSINFIRRIDGHSNVKRMFSCGHCRPLIKTDIEYADEGGSCYGDDVYGKSMFDVYQHLSFGPDSFREVCSSIVKTYQWTHINEPRFLAVVQGVVNKIYPIGTQAQDVAQRLRGSFDTYFKTVGYDTFVVELLSGEGPRKPSLKFTAKSKEGTKCGRNRELKTLSVQPTPEQSTQVLSQIWIPQHSEADASWSWVTQGDQLLVDPEFLGDYIMQIDYDVYIKQLSDDLLSRYGLLVLSQIIMAEASIQQSTLDRLIAILLAEYHPFRVVWLEPLLQFIQNSEKLSKGLLENYRTDLLAELTDLAATTVNQDTCKLAASACTPFSAEEGVSLVSSLSRQLSTNHPHFDSKFCRDLLRVLHKQGLGGDDVSRVLEISAFKGEKRYRAVLQIAQPLEKLREWVFANKGREIHELMYVWEDDLDAEEVEKIR